MKDLKEYLIESADKATRAIFGKPISLSPALSSLFNKLGMDFRHTYDKFVLFEDGRLEYYNTQLFDCKIYAKVKKGMINRIIPPAEIDKILTVQPVSPCAYMEPCGCGCTPLYYIKAILNAITNKTYTIDATGAVVINDLDYTSGDFEKDKVKEDGID